ncbi:MAG: hypothetical protein KIPDCIKN_03445 [Haliscomenobacter sp.]|jgi:hypothetical protein|nr:hypothetical protein [Haliscomenobacter sp.]
MLIHLLNARYPLARNRAAEAVFILGTGAFVAGFLIIFQPFGTDAFQSETKYLFLGGYGAVISGTMFLCSLLLPWGFPGVFQEESWTVGKQILFFLFVFSLVFGACYLYKNLYLGVPISLLGFLGFFPIAFSVAIFPITGLVTANYIYLLKRYQKGAHDVERAPVPADLPEIVLCDDQGKPALKVRQDQLLFLKSAGNYVEAFFLEGETCRRTLLRNTLAALELVLAGSPVERCHRSYLANLALVTRVSGNAQGYLLHFGGCAHTVPVARSKSAEILEKVN